VKRNSFTLKYVNGCVKGAVLNISGVPRGGGWGFKPPSPSKFRRPSKIVPNSTRLWKLLKIAEFRTPTPQDVRKKGSKILKLPPVHNCFALAMTNKLVVIINSLKVPKIEKILLYEMKFLVPNYSCLHDPWLGGYRPQIPVLSVLCPQLNLLNPPPLEKKFLGTPMLNMEDFDHNCKNPPASMQINFRVQANAFPDCLQVFLWAYSDWQTRSVIYISSLYLSASTPGSFLLTVIVAGFKITDFQTCWFCRHPFAICSLSSRGEWHRN